MQQWIERAGRLARLQEAAEVKIRSLQAELDLKQQACQTLEARSNQFAHIERLLETGSEGLEFGSIETIKRTKGAEAQATEFYSLCLLLNAKLREQVKENEKHRRKEAELEEKVNKQNLEMQYLRRAKTGEKEQMHSFVPASDLKRPRDVSNTQPLCEFMDPLSMPKRAKQVPTFMQSGKK